MKFVMFLAVIAINASLSGDAFAGWSDDFESYALGGMLISPWENSNVNVLEYGYGGSQGASRNGYGEWNAHSAYRLADPGNTLVAKLYNAANNYDYETSSVALTSAKGPDGELNGSYYYTLIKLAASGTSSNTLSFDMNNPTGTNFHHATVPDLAWNQWYDAKIVVSGRMSTGYYRPSGTANWILIGSYIQPTGFTSYSYVGISSMRFGTIDDVSWSDAATISGSISLSDFAGVVSLVPINIQLVQGGAVVQTEEVRLTSNPGSYSLNVISGTYDLVFSACQSLRTIVRNVTAPRGSIGTANVTLANGDVNGDNEVTSTDLSIVLRNRNITGD